MESNETKEFFENNEFSAFGKRSARRKANPRRGEWQAPTRNPKNTKSATASLFG